MVVAMLSWAIYSALLKKKTYEISQITLLQVVIITGLIFLIPISLPIITAIGVIEYFYDFRRLKYKKN